MCTGQIIFYSSILLVRILDETLVLGDEPRHDSIVTLCHLVLDILGTLAYRLDGLVNSKTKRMPENPIHVLHARLHIETAVDGERTDGQLQLVCQHEGSSTEYTHVTCEGAGAFGEDNQ